VACPQALSWAQTRGSPGLLLPWSHGRMVLHRGARRFSVAVPSVVSLAARHRSALLMFRTNYSGTFEWYKNIRPATRRSHAFSAEHALLMTRENQRTSGHSRAVA
jgi:hypothetical protein